MENEIKLDAVETTEPVKRKAPARKNVESEVAEAPKYIDPKEARRREVEAKWKKERAEKSVPVTGKFLFNECPGGELKFPYREFPGDELVNYTMKHDQIYTVPLGVAMHLNDRCAYNEYFHNLDGGKAISADNMYITAQVHRTNFIPLNYMHNVGPSNIAKVTKGNPLDNRFNLDAEGR